ncbi:MAG TPA: phosphatase PAP2 family protein [Gaiellaceae bacterium]|nr:phosphatase PAP2 family protein [Gaiellaceae bacterium]
MSLRSAVAAALFALLAILVAAGAFTGLDQWSVDHLMPGAHFRAGTPSVVDAIVPFSRVDWSSGWDVAVNVVALPGSFLVALALVGLRSRPLLVVLVACAAVEGLLKELLVRPALHHGPLHVVAFDSSFPSGHALRAVLLAIAFRPLLHDLAVAWAVAVLVLILLAGWHTPTDVAGGILLGLAGGGAAAALRARGLARPARA